jgi:NOL1/NOP2/fmu family ribosome biogenesis protein
MLLRPNARPPKLSTSGAMLLGSQAGANVVELTRSQIGPYLARAELALAPAQLEACTGSGYVLLRYLGFGLGLGYLDIGARRLESLFPKRWMGGLA